MKRIVVGRFGELVSEIEKLALRAVSFRVSSGEEGYVVEWEEHGPDRTSWVFDPKSGDLRYLAGGFIAQFYPTSTEKEGRLAAAAPELREACRAALAYLGEESGAIVSTSRMVEMLKVALEKAG